MIVKYKIKDGFKLWYKNNDNIKINDNLPSDKKQI